MMDEHDTWVWIGVGKRQAINLRHVSAIEFMDGEPPSAHLSLTISGALGRVTVAGPEAVALRAHLHRVARHLEDLAAG